MARSTTRASEYARMGAYMHINTAESFYSIFKRGIGGVYHSVSEAHLHRNLAEFDFRYKDRSGLASRTWSAPPNP